MPRKVVTHSPNGTRSKEAKLHRAFAKNWENCQEKYKAWQPNDRYRFTASQMNEMGKIAQEDFSAALWVYKEAESKTRAANEAQMPYYLFVHLLKKHEKEQEQEHEIRIQRNVFSKLTTGRGELTEAQRLKRLSRALITEMEERVATNKTRDEMSNSELVNMNKMIVATVTALEMGTTGESDGVEFTVITHMPEKDYSKKTTGRSESDEGPRSNGSKN